MAGVWPHRLDREARRHLQSARHYLHLGGLGALGEMGTQVTVPGSQLPLPGPPILWERALLLLCLYHVLTTT